MTSLVVHAHTAQDRRFLPKRKVRQLIHFAGIACRLLHGFGERAMALFLFFYSQAHWARSEASILAREAKRVQCKRVLLW